MEFILKGWHKKCQIQEEKNLLENCTFDTKPHCY